MCFFNGLMALLVCKALNVSFICYQMLTGITAIFRIPPICLNHPIALPYGEKEDRFAV